MSTDETRTARFMVEVSTAADVADRYDLPPSAGLDLSQEVISAVARSPFLAGAEVSVNRHDECHPPPPPPLSPYAELLRLRARMHRDAAADLERSWPGCEQADYLRGVADNLELGNPDTSERVWHETKFHSTHRKQLIELLAGTDTEALRSIALSLADDLAEVAGMLQEMKLDQAGRKTRTMILAAERDRFARRLKEHNSSLPTEN